ncbi:hypothetical protein G7Y79_00003g010900 [Physcia stellaris]|nr:hypothetical protein G7Y79_00003g010900 [Physcia stellaris]
MLRSTCLILLTLLISVTCEDQVACFAGGPGSQVHPTTFRACRDVIRWIGFLHQDDGLITFSRSFSVGYKVPAHWVGGDCALGIDMRSDHDVDTMFFRDISMEAYRIALACIIHPPHLGGTRPVGPKGVLNVTVWGIAQRPGGIVPLIAPKLNETRILHE